MNVGDKVKLKRPLFALPFGSVGVVVQDYGTGFLIAWDKPGELSVPYPYDKTPQEVAEMAGSNPNCPLRDGFDKETELDMLEVIGTI